MTFSEIETRGKLPHGSSERAHVTGRDLRASEIKLMVTLRNAGDGHAERTAKKKKDNKRNSNCTLLIAG
jgi:hypothetical protein